MKALTDKRNYPVGSTLDGYNGIGNFYANADPNLQLRKYNVLFQIYLQV